MTALSVQGLFKRYGRVHVLNGVDLDIARGSITAILGPSGCGKTTLLRLVAGFDRADAGTITLNGTNVSSGRNVLPPDKRDIGYVAQEGALFPHLDVQANITFGLPYLSTGRHQRRHRAAALLELVSLDPALARRYPHQLSGGQQQRVALARALARKPSLVLLDEPFSSLDAALREATRTAVAAALKAENVSTLLVTHDQAEALSMADHIAVMTGGRFTQTGPPQQLYAQPATLDTALLLGPASTLHGKVDNGRAICPLGALPLIRHCPDGDATILIRPEQIHLSGDAATTGAATVVRCEFFGADMVVTAQLAGGATIRARATGTTTYHPGQPITVTVHGPVHAYAGHLREGADLTTP
ncbi:ABC transporter ATP-binding protein [Dactylosporangium sp. NPDC049525]|uniref:ABC transporter ATP-binding protein n=1 Tax=Dactylosporangium sp. NPDC049525 TaxID=3154730 RepID=UPI00342E28B3